MSTRSDAFHDDTPGGDGRREQTHEQWWAGLSLEDRYHAIETVRLDADPDGPVLPDRPVGERAEFVRRQPEYLERYAAAERIAAMDDSGGGLDTRPDALDRTRPLGEGERPDDVDA